jgi:hypothetical protein
MARAVGAFFRVCSVHRRACVVAAAVLRHVTGAAAVVGPVALHHCANGGIPRFETDIRETWEKIVDVKSRSAHAAMLLLLAGGLAGCAASATNGDPGPKPLPAGYSCQSVRAELNKLDARGVPSKVEAMSAGRSLSGSDRELAQRYNTLLNYYLGGRCHV